MPYRIVKRGRRADGSRDSVEIGTYDSAYRAMRVMKDELSKRGAGPLDWYLLDPQGDILASPEDVIDALVA